MPAQIRVLAGVNGAGKSSIIGATIRDRGGDYYNPDEAARQIMAQLAQAAPGAAAVARSSCICSATCASALPVFVATT